MFGILAQSVRTVPVTPSSGGTDYFMQIGVAGILVMLILQLVFKFLRDMKDKRERNGGSTDLKTDTGSFVSITSQNVSDIFKFLGDIKNLTAELHSWHNVRDDDHVFAWYIRKSLALSIERLNKAVADLAANVAKQNELLRHLAEEEDRG